MGNTVDLGLRYPDEDDTPDVPSDIQKLAEDVEDNFNAFRPTIFTNILPGPGTTDADADRRVAARLIWGTNVQMKGLLRNSSGAGIALGATLCTLPAGLRPIGNSVYFPCTVTGTGGAVIIEIKENGDIASSDLLPNNSIICLDPVCFAIS